MRPVACTLLHARAEEAPADGSIPIMLGTKKKTLPAMTGPSLWSAKGALCNFLWSGRAALLSPSLSFSHEAAVVSSMMGNWRERLERRRHFEIPTQARRHGPQGRRMFITVPLQAHLQPHDGEELAAALLAGPSQPRPLPQLQPPLWRP